MKDKRFTLICAVASLLLSSGVCSATVPEDVEDTKPAVKASGQMSVTTGKSKVMLPRKNANTKNDVRIYTDKNKLKVAAAKTVPKSEASVPKAAVKNTNGLTEQDGKYYFSGTELPVDYRSISIYGDAVATKAQAVAFIKSNNPDVRLSCSVEELVDLYWEEAEREQVRPDLALAQSIVETGFYRYGGDVQHHQNNFCGLGTTGNGVRGATFKTPQIGVRAHIQHLLAYTQKKRPSTAIVDPRYELAHNIRLERGVVDTWYGLNGTWAMGSLYCEKIMAAYQKMLAQSGGAAIKEDNKQQDKDKKTVKEDKRSRKERLKAEKEAKKKAKELERQQHKMRERIAKILRNSK